MADKKYLLIGSYTPETEDAPEIIEREFYGQGMIFKDEDAFLNHSDKVCYIPELHDGTYTRQSFIDLCGGREDFAELCFDIVDWQSPETWVEEQFVNGEWDECPNCKRWFSLYASPPAPCDKCGAELKNKWGNGE